MKTLSIVIPVYYNQDSLLSLYEALLRVEEGLKPLDCQLQLIFVNDGSRDGSLDRLRELKQRRPDLIILNHLANRGSMSAIQTGLRRVTGDCFTYLAADLQDPPLLLIEMFQRWLGGQRLVVATRSSREDPLSTRFFAWLNYKLVRMLIFKDYPAGGFDMALMDKVFLRPLISCGHNKNLAMQAWSLGIPAALLSYHRQERKHGKSMWTFRKKLNYFIDSTVGYSVKPIRILTFFGFLLAAGCFTYSSIVILGRLFGWITVPGFAALASILGFLHGCAFIMIGVIGEYIWRIYIESGHKQESLHEEID